MDVLEFKSESQRKRQPRNARLGSQTILEAARVCPLRATLGVKGKALPTRIQPHQTDGRLLGTGPRQNS